MRNKIIISGLLLCGLLASTMALRAFAEDKMDKGTLKQQATVTKSEAKKVALAEVKKRGLYHAKVKEAELEQEKGLLIWSFDIATRGTKDITEVQVDAKTGAIVSVTTESARDEAKEKVAGKEKEEDEKGEKK
jgi:peptidase YpeB-like protein